MTDTTIFISLACIFGFIMAFGVGANDVANAMGTSVGSKALTVKQAILIAAIFEFLGAFLAGGAVTHTISKGIVDTSVFTANPTLFVYGMLASLLAAGLWLLFASRWGWPVSTTHSIVGAIVGFSTVTVGSDAVEWTKIITIVMSWIISPLLGGILAYLLFYSIQRLIFNSSDPFLYAKRYIPYYILIASFVFAMMTIRNGLKYIGIHFTLLHSIGIALLFSVILFLLGLYKITKIHSLKNRTTLSQHFVDVEKAFAVLMGFTACAMAFAHGSNDVANAVGPLAGIVHVMQVHEFTSMAQTPAWILFLGGAGIVVGLVLYGHKVIQTVGSGITELTPSRGFAATLAAAATVVIASGTGIPISTTHTLVGGVLGVGIARGIGAVNLNIVKIIIVSWLITLPAGAILAIVIYYGINWLLPA